MPPGSDEDEEDGEDDKGTEKQEECLFSSPSICEVAADESSRDGGERQSSSKRADEAGVEAQLSFLIEGKNGEQADVEGEEGGDESDQQGLFLAKFGEEEARDFVFLDGFFGFSEEEGQE